MPSSPADAVLIGKLKAGRPVVLDPGERRLLIEAMREAIGVAVECSPEKVTDDTRLFEDLGMDSIDVFDVLDQLAARYEAQVTMEELPLEILRADHAMTFLQFAEGILGFFCAPPKPVDTVIASARNTTES